MALALLMWGADPHDKKEEGVAGTESVEKEKTGFAGVMEKVKRVVKGEKAPAKEVAEEEENGSVTGESDAVGGAVDQSNGLAESAGAEGQTPEERNRLLKDKFGHLEENGSASESDAGVNVGRDCRWSRSFCQRWRSRASGSRGNGRGG